MLGVIVRTIPPSTAGRELIGCQKIYGRITRRRYGGDWSDEGVPATPFAEFE